MSTTVTKLFRLPGEAQSAVKELKAKGFKAEEIGILVGDKKGSQFAAEGVLVVKNVSLPNVESVLAIGATAASLSKGGKKEGTAPKAALIELWGVPEETIDYYGIGLALGGVVVSVSADEARAAEIHGILEGAEAASLRACEPLSDRSPGFLMAGRMTATNPLDAKMSGDFRKY